MYADYAAEKIKIEWEFKSFCPDVEIAELAALKNQDSTYFVNCGKLKKVSGQIDSTDCTALENADPANFYIKKDLAKSHVPCVIETTSKIIIN